MHPGLQSLLSQTVWISTPGAVDIWAKPTWSTAVAYPARISKATGDDLIGLEERSRTNFRVYIYLPADFSIDCRIQLEEDGKAYLPLSVETFFDENGVFHHHKAII